MTVFHLKKLFYGSNIDQLTTNNFIGVVQSNRNSISNKWLALFFFTS